MIIRTQISFTVAGPGFDPAAFDLPWTSTDFDPPNGEGCGKVHYDLSEFADQEDAIESLHKHFYPQLAALRRSGVDYIDLFISWTYDSQCAGSFTPKEMQWIADLGCGLALDCYKSYDEEETQEAEQVETQQPPLAALSSTSPVT
jgi:hypothetical protein